MTLPLPDKYVRKAIFTALNHLNIDGNVIPVFDTRATDDNARFFVLMTTQTNDESIDSKCDSRWNSSILLDIVTRYDGGGNIGSRVLADNIASEVIERTDNIVLDIESGLKVFRQRFTLPNDISTVTSTTNIFRKLIRIELVLQRI